MARTPQLLDHRGNPIERAALSTLQGEPGLISVRQAWTQTVASGLTPARLAAILHACDQGEMTAYLALAEEMEERDPHYASVLGTRKRAVSGVKPVVEAASEEAADETLAQAVRDAITSHTDFSGLVTDLLDGLGKGFSAVEIDWDTTRTPWRPAAFKHRNAQWFRFDRETGEELRLIDEAGPVDGVALKPFGWLVHRPKLKSGLTARSGLARLVAFSWMCKAYTLKDWMAFVEVYGLPLRLGRYGREATKTDVQALFTAVSNIGTDAAAVLPRHMEIEFAAGPTATGEAIFEKLARYVDEQISKAVLGQTMTADSGSSRSQAEVHNEVRHDIAEDDARAVQATLNRDLVKPFIDLNFGVQERYPTLVIPVAAPEDTTALIDNAVKLAKAGVRLKASELRAKLGLSDPDDDDDVIGGQPPAQSTTPAPAARNRGLAVNRAGDPSSDGPYPALEEIEYEALKDWQPQMGALLDPVIEVIQEAGSYAEALEALALIVPRMEAGPLIDGLVQSTFKARALGDVTDGSGG